MRWSLCQALLPPEARCQLVTWSGLLRHGADRQSEPQAPAAPPRQPLRSLNPSSLRPAATQASQPASSSAPGDAELWSAACELQGRAACLKWRGQALSQSQVLTAAGLSVAQAAAREAAARAGRASKAVAALDARRAAPFMDNLQVCRLQEH